MLVVERPNWLPLEDARKLTHNFEVINKGKKQACSCLSYIIISK